MWTREMLKTNAKFALKARYWMAVLVSLIAGFLMGGSSGFSGMSSFRYNLQTNSTNFSGIKDFFTQNSRVLLPIMAGAAVIGFIAICASIAFGIFVANPVGVGQNSYYLQNRIGKGEITTLFSAFKAGYLNVVKVLFFKNLYIFLWSLLFIIPGIIKTYEYFAVDYILAENPHMDEKRALELSRLMTQGEKWNIFVVGLSFIGWVLLSMFTCFIGLIFLKPYIQATFAELYTALREKALAQNLAGTDELPGFAAPDLPNFQNPVF